MIFLLSQITQAQPKDVSFHQYGYIENRLWFYPDPLQDIPSFKNTLRWRPTFVGEMTKESTTYKISLTPNVIFNTGRDFISDTQKLLEPTILEQIPPDFNGNKPDFDDVLLECNWIVDGENDITNIRDVLTFPRFFIDINTQKLDLRIGKQALNWGSALFFNPTDVVFQYLFAQPWQERKGFEGIKLQMGKENWLLTTMGAVDVSSTPLLTKTHSQNQLPWYTGIRWTYNTKRQKISAISGFTHDTSLIGIDIKGDITSRNIGYWFEGSIKQQRTHDSSFLQYSVGIDDSFDILDGMRIGFQLSHDGSGETPLFYEWSSREIFTVNAQITDCDSYHIKVPQRGDEQRFLLGRWYGLGIMEMQFQSYWRIQIPLFSNLIDKSTVALPSIIYDQGDFLAFMGLQSRLGSEGEFNPPFSQRNIMGVDLEVLYPSTQFLMWIRWSY